MTLNSHELRVLGGPYCWRCGTQVKEPGNVCDPCYADWDVGRVAVNAAAWIQERV